jgi:hypothetical protein
MKRESFYLGNGAIREINKLNICIEKNNCRQMNLLNSKELSRLTQDNRSSDFSEESINNLWQLGFLNADIVKSYERFDIEGIIFIDKKEDVFLYVDERSLPIISKGYADSIAGLKEIPQHIEPLFHPFRCYALYHIHRILKSHFTSIQILQNTKGFDNLILWHIKAFNNFTSKPETSKLFNYWNTITSIAVISEPVAHQIIFNKVTWDAFYDNYDNIVNNLNKLHEITINLFLIIGEEPIEYYRKEICRDAEIIDPNKYLHLIIRLMKADERNKLKGHISSAILFLTMAECLRRNLEDAFRKELPEEDECGFGTVFRDTKLLLQGSTRVLDGNRVVANQFLRRFGLDYGIRVNVYLEGETEFEALISEFNTNSSILFINLKGQFVERRGKGVAFRESLRNDIKSKTFSIILLDGDVSDNFRAVRQAAEADEICGMFFVFNPDFEIHNFSVNELAKVAAHIAQDKGLEVPSLAQIKEHCAKATTAKEFFKILYDLSPNFSSLSKGGNWGKALVNFAMKNPLSKEFGDKNDRTINRVIKIIYHSSSSSYEATRQKYKVDPNTGQLIKRLA